VCALLKVNCIVLIKRISITSRDIPFASIILIKYIYSGTREDCFLRYATIHRTVWQESSMHDQYPSTFSAVKPMGFVYMYIHNIELLLVCSIVWNPSHCIDKQAESGFDNETI